MGRSTIIQGMHSSCTGYAIVGTVYNHPRDAFPLHSVRNCCVPVVSLLDGLQSSNGRLSPALSMQLSVSWSFAYRRVYNHPRDAFLLLRARNCWSSSCWPIGRSIISQRMRSSCTGYAIIVVGLSDGLQSSKGCVSLALSMLLSVSWLLAYRTVYNHPRDAFLLL